MRRTYKMIPITVLTLASAMAADTIDGVWTASFKTMSGAQKLTWTFSTSGGKLTGTSASASGRTTIEKGVATGSHVAWVEMDLVDGVRAAMKYEGSIAGDTMHVTRTPVNTLTPAGPNFGAGGFTIDDSATATRVK